MQAYIDALEKEARLNEAYQSLLERKRQSYEKLAEGAGNDRAEEYRHAIHIYCEEEAKIRVEQEALRARVEQERQRKPLSSGEEEYQSQKLEKERIRVGNESEAAENVFEDAHHHYMVQCGWAATDQSAEAKSAARTAEAERELAKTGAYHRLQVERSYENNCEEAVESGEGVDKATPVKPSQLPPEVLDALKGGQFQRERFRGQQLAQPVDENINNGIDEDLQCQEPEKRNENDFNWHVQFDDGMGI